MPGEWQPRPHPKSPKKAEPPPLAEHEQSSTEMIDRNTYMLHRLQSEIDRLKAELARQKKELQDVTPKERDASLEEILREARKQLARLQGGTPPPDSDGELQG